MWWSSKESPAIPILGTTQVWKDLMTSMQSGVSYYRQVSQMRRTLIGNKFVDNSNVVGASPAGAAPTTSELST